MPGSTHDSPSRFLGLALAAVALAISGCAIDVEDELADDLLGAKQELGTDVHLRTQRHSERLLFNPARDSLNVGYHSFRIPALVRTANGVLLAFAEGRQCSSDDYGNINLVYKMSFNDGRSWTSLRQVVGKGPGTWGNPTAVSDEQTGRVWLFMSWNSAATSQEGHDINPCTGELTRRVGIGDRKVFVTYSDNDGITWSEPVDMTASLQPPGMDWDAIGPGVGIQKTVGPRAGRLVVPAIGRNIYSDDHGVTWQYQLLSGGTSEGTVVELSDGQLLRNDRAVTPVWLTAKRRWMARGTINDGFSDFAPHPTLYDPKVEGSALRYTGSWPHRLLFLNPASTKLRCKMRVRISYDDGETWPVSRQVHEEMSATETCRKKRGGYSSMAKTADFHVGALVERGGEHSSIEFHRFNLPWILNGTAEPVE